MKKEIMRLQKILNRKVGHQKYWKFRATIPIKILNELEWTEKTQLTFRLEPKSNPTRLIIEKELK